MCGPVCGQGRGCLRQWGREQRPVEPVGADEGRGSEWGLRGVQVSAIGSWTLYHVREFQFYLRALRSQWQMLGE